MNPDKTKRPTKLGPLAIDFTADVEIATEAALKDRPDLQAAWLELAQEHSTNRTVAKEVIHRCGAEYTRRGLDPKEYFTHVKRRRGEPIPR